MLTRLVHRFLGKRHFWREADFSELADLYASRMLRAMAIGMVAVFVGIYLLRNGYGLAFILFYFAVYFLTRTILAWPAALLVGRVGPKHSEIIANLLYVPALLALALLPQLHWPALIAFLFLQGFSVTLYDIAFFVSLSKVKHRDHAGKEMGFVIIVTHLGTALSPLIGGLSATLLGAPFTMLVAALVFMVAAIPSLFKPEPVLTHQHVTLKGLPIRAIVSQLRSQFGLGTDFATSGQIWSLFVAIVVLSGSGAAVYAKIGALSSITLLAALLSAQAFGAIVDRKQGRNLLDLGTIFNSVLHLSRPFTTNVVGVATTNLANELTTTAYNLPYTTGMCDAADSLPGYRIAYLSLMEAAGSLGAGTMMAAAAISVTILGDVNGLKIAFCVAAVSTLLIATNGFRLFTPAARV